MHDVIEAIGSKPMVKADEWDIPKSSLSAFLNGTQRLAAPHLVTLAQRLKTSVEVLESVWAQMNEESMRAALGDRSLPFRVGTHGVHLQKALEQASNAATDFGRRDLSRRILTMLDEVFPPEP